GRDPGRERRSVEARDEAHAAAPRDEGAEQLVHAVTQRCDGAHAGDNDAAAHAPSQRRQTTAAHWPNSVQPTFRKYGRPTRRGSRDTATGHSGSGSSQLSVAGRVPCSSASRLALSSTAPAAGPRLPKYPLAAKTGTGRPPSESCKPRASHTSLSRL